MKKWFTKLGWLDAFSLFVLWMLLCREYAMFIALGIFFADLKRTHELCSFGDSSDFVLGLLYKSSFTFLLIIVCLLLQCIKLIKQSQKNKHF